MYIVKYVGGNYCLEMEISMSKILSVLYQSDNNYAELTGVSMLSLFENNKHLDEIHIYLLNDQISEMNLGRIWMVCNQYRRKLTVIDTTTILNKLKELKVQPYKNTYTTYFKLFAIRSLDLPTERILQLDGDTIINRPLDELLEMDLEDVICAATYDCILNAYKTLVDIPLTDLYYNCGVLLINQENWRKFQCEDEIVNHLLHVRNRYFTVDQDIINVLFRDKIKYLHLKYNFNSGFFVYGIKESFRIYGLDATIFSAPSLVEEAYQEPYIYHCMGAMTGRPWEAKNIHPQNDLYDQYRIISPWKDLPKVTKRYGFMFRMQRRLYLLLPRRIYSQIHRLMLLWYLKKKNEEAIHS